MSAPRTARPRLAGMALGLVAGLACAPALREPPPLGALAGGGELPGEPGAVEASLAEADALHARRTIVAVREAARLRLQAAAADPRRTEALVGAVAALVWVVDHEPKPQTRRQDALRAVQAAQWCRRLAPENPACDYWLGAALGVQARERASTGLSALPRIEAALARAAAADPSLEKGGPHRALALLYLRAPGWPTGPGDPDLGLEHAERALALFPEHPPNLLALGEALAAVGRDAESLAAYRRALTAAESPAAQGDPDAAEWAREARRALAGSTPE